MSSTAQRKLFFQHRISVYHQPILFSTFITYFRIISPSQHRFLPSHFLRLYSSSPFVLHVSFLLHSDQTLVHTPHITFPLSAVCPFTCQPFIYARSASLRRNSSLVMKSLKFTFHYFQVFLHSRDPGFIPNLSTPRIFLGVFIFIFFCKGRLQGFSVPFFQGRRSSWAESSSSSSASSWALPCVAACMRAGG